MRHKIFGEVDNQVWDEVKYITGRSRIGKSSAFSRAYAYLKYVYVLSNDPAKECLALFTDKSNPHNPKVERIDITDKGALYRVPKYSGTRGLNKQGKKDLKILYELARVFCREDGEVGLRELLLSALSVPVKECLHDMIEAYGNYVDPRSIRLDCWEGNSNCMSDDVGNLILLDVLHDTEKSWRSLKVK